MIRTARSGAKGTIRLIVPVLPRISIATGKSLVKNALVALALRRISQGQLPKSDLSKDRADADGLRIFPVDVDCDRAVGQKLRHSLVAE
jgi:hypothetical protein